ncbi:MAG TPA: hypothetical protein VF880_01300, partial [Actinomycetes bacterium]
AGRRDGSLSGYMMASSAPRTAAVPVAPGPAALTTRACAPMGLGTGNSAAGRPPCRRAAAPRA